MSYLPLANLLQHKLPSVLTALGIGIGICMLITLSGLSRGSLGEVADRWESVHADLIAYPKGWGDNITTLSGLGLGDRYREKFLESNGDLIQAIAPVFLWQLKIGGQDNMTTGIDPGDWNQITNGKKLLEGRLPDAEGKFAAWIEHKLLTKTDDDTLIEITPADMAAHGGMELVVDERLAKTAKFKVGQVVQAGEHEWTIVGIAPTGVMTRVFMPRRTGQYLYGNGSILRSTMMFIKLRDGVEPAAAATKLSRDGADIMQLKQYRGRLEQKFGMIYMYVDAANAFTLVIAFLFIMITLYTMVLQRNRDIAILKSFGASNGFILWQVLAESMLLTFAGTAMGIGLSFFAAWLLSILFPLLTVQITPLWITVGAAVAFVGATVSALYPAWRASRVDTVATLTLE